PRDFHRQGRCLGFFEYLRPWIASGTERELPEDVAAEAVDRPDTGIVHLIGHVPEARLPKALPELPLEIRGGGVREGDGTDLVQGNRRLVSLAVHVRAKKIEDTANDGRRLAGA